MARLLFSEITNNENNIDIRTNIPKYNNIQAVMMKDKRYSLFNCPLINPRKNANSAQSHIISEMVQRAVNTLVAVVPSLIFRQYSIAIGSKSGIMIPPNTTASETACQSDPTSGDSGFTINPNITADIMP